MKGQVVVSDNAEKVEIGKCKRTRSKEESKAMVASGKAQQTSRSGVNNKGSPAAKVAKTPVKRGNKPVVARKLLTETNEP